MPSSSLHDSDSDPAVVVARPSYRRRYLLFVLSIVQYCLYSYDVGRSIYLLLRKPSSAAGWLCSHQARLLACWWLDAAPVPLFFEAAARRKLAVLFFDRCVVVVSRAQTTRIVRLGAFDERYFVDQYGSFRIIQYICNSITQRFLLQTIDYVL